MSRLLQLARTLRRDRTGAVAVEFALIGPMFLALFLGVLQFGIGMQNYNAMRSISADVARYAAVTYQKGTKPGDTDIETYASGVASAAPYNLMSGRLTIDAATVASTQFTGAKEITLTMTYSVPSMLTFFGLDDIPLSYSRPIFVMP